LNILIIINEAPYGTERCYNALRLALALQKEGPRPAVTVFLMADAVLAAKSGQRTPEGYYNVERMLRGVLSHGEVLLCGTCLDARGLQESELAPGARRSSMAQLAERTLAADRVLVF